MRRNLSLYFDEQGDHRPTYIVRDRDTKYTFQFCSILESTGIQFQPIPPRSPNMNPFAESWIQRVKSECLDHFIILGEQHLRYVLREYLVHFHEERPHQGLGNQPANQTTVLDEIASTSADQVVCHERLGGLLKHYERRAA